MKTIRTFTTRKLLLLFLVACLAVGLAVNSSAVSAGSAASAPRIGAGSASQDAPTPSPETYWTPERMASAIPYPLDGFDTSQPSSPLPEAPAGAGKPGWYPSRPPDGYTGGVVTNGKAGTVPAPKPTGANVTAYVPEPDINTFPYRPSGKVYFTMMGRNYVCSASVIGENTIWTAGHCVSNGRGQFHSNWIFIPGFDNYTTIFPGPWFVSSYVAPVEWTRSADLTYDYAIVGVWSPNPVIGSKTIRQYTGALGFAWNMPRAQKWTLLGYPMVTFNGANMVYSKSTHWTDNPLYNPASVGVGSTINSGGSGGPWILNFQRGQVGQVNYLNGENSYINGTADEVFSPYFDDRAKQLWDCSQGPTPTLDWSCFAGSVPGNLTMSYDPGAARPNKPFAYKLKIKNPGNATATGVVLTDTSDYAIVSADLPGGNCIINGNSVTCTLASLPAHATSNISLVVIAPNAGDGIGNVASMTFDQLQKWDTQVSFRTVVKAGK